MKNGLTVLENARAYLSGPIEHDKPGHNWRIEPSRVLRDHFKIDLFDPFQDPKQQWSNLLLESQAKKDYAKMTEIAKAFVRKDLSVVDRSDLLIAYLPYRVPTCGTHHEIINSNAAKKPTLLVCPEGKEKVPLWYFGFIPHEAMFGSWEELYSYLTDVNDGKLKDNNRWHYIYGLI